MIAVVSFLPAIGLIGVAYWAYKRGSNSAREDKSDTENTSISSLPDSVLDSLGWPYFFGKGSPSTNWSDGKNGVDCSGYAQMVLVKLGKLSPTASDRGARTLADDSDSISVGKQRTGDLAYYPGHVMIVAGEPDSVTGHSPVIGASGGTETTLGNDSNAKVKMFDSALYRNDFVTYMRLK